MKAALPTMGVDGSLASTGRTLPGRGRVHAKPGTTVIPTPDGDGIQLKAQNLAGYIDTRSGRRVAYVVMVNDVGEVTSVDSAVEEVFEDEGKISSLIFEAL